MTKVFLMSLFILGAVSAQVRADEVVIVEETTVEVEVTVEETTVTVTEE